MISWLVIVAIAAPVEREVSGAATLATLADGPGVVAEIGATSLDFLGGSAPEVPVAPRLSLGALLEPSPAVLVGARVGVATWFDAGAVEPSGEAAATFALGNRARTVWTGGEVGAGVSDDGASLLAAATFGVDVDPLSSIGVRLGMVVQPGGAIEQRHGVVFMYRPTPRTGASLGVHGGYFYRDAAPKEPVYPVTAQVLFHARFGPIIAPWTPPKRVEKRVTPIDVQEHPELQCGPGDYPTGRPPPLGQEGWCARVALNGTIKRQGPYVRWHDMLVLAERGQYTDGLRSGEWIRYDHEGNVRERGEFVLDLEEGHWVNYWADGAIQEEGDMLRGEPNGRWRFHDENGRLRVTGEYQKGDRVGRWIDYAVDGTEERERIYESGRLVTTNQLTSEEEEDPGAPTIEGAAGEPKP